MLRLKLTSILLLSVMHNFASDLTKLTIPEIKEQLNQIAFKQHLIYHELEPRSEHDDISPEATSRRLLQLNKAREELLKLLNEKINTEEAKNPINDLYPDHDPHHLRPEFELALAEAFKADCEINKERNKNK